MDDFNLYEIDENVFSRIKGKSYKADCTVPLSELRYLKLRHVDGAGKLQMGEMICSRIIAEDLLEIFEKLLKAAYPIEKVRLIDAYDADDESSMADNNSSCFNYRCISFTDIVSKHGLGMAVDINPLYNPYVKEVDGRLSIEPAKGRDYVDRSRVFPYKIDENDLAYRLFRQYGFEWGGSWKDAKDYQHFEMPSERIKKYFPDWKGGVFHA